MLLKWSKLLVSKSLNSVSQCQISTPQAQRLIQVWNRARESSVLQAPSSSGITVHAAYFEIKLQRRKSFKFFQDLTPICPLTYFPPSDEFQLSNLYIPHKLNCCLNAPCPGIPSSRHVLFKSIQPLIINSLCNFCFAFSTRNKTVNTYSIIFLHLMAHVFHYYKWSYYKCSRTLEVQT